MKVVVTFPIPDVAKQMISEHAALQCWESEESIPVSTLIDWVADADAILTTLTCPIGSEVLAHAPQLKVISTVSVGVPFRPVRLNEGTDVDRHLRREVIHCAALCLQDRQSLPVDIE